MAITAETKVRDLVETYPYLLDWLVSYSSEFKKLKNPVLYNTVARAATLEAAASMADVTVDKFLDDVRTEVARREIVAEETAGASGEAGAASPGSEPSVDDAPDGDRARRQEALKGIIRKLHDGYSVDAVKDEFDALVSQVDSVEIAAMEQALIAEGMPVGEVQRLCDVHVSVFKESLAEQPEATLPDSHPVSAYRRENVRIGELVSALRCTIEEASPSSEDDARARTLASIAEQLRELQRIDIHYLRKENQLFPVLEKHGVEGPTKVMWGLNDDIRGRLKSAATLAEAGDLDSLVVTLPETLGMVEDMVYKEEKILFPTALQVVTTEEWDDMAAGDADIGYAWGEGATAGGAADTGTAGGVVPAPAPGVASAEAQHAGPMLLPLPTGALSLAQLDALFRAIPFDVTYVDENDRVRFYSEGERVFPRSPAVIGREVRNCHPPKSVDKVEKMLAEFKAGTKDAAEFWIELSGRFIHIRYFAMRSAEGTYQGCLEVVQDATHVRSLEGQQRLLDW